MRRRGQGLVEFALVLPLLLFLVMAIADFGRLLLIYAELAGGVREALRYAIVNAPASSMTTQQWNQYCNVELLNRLKAALVLTPPNALVPGQTYFVSFEPFRYDTNSFDPAVPCPPPSDKKKNFVLKREDRVVIEVRVTVSTITPFIQAVLPQAQIQYKAGRTVFPPDGVYFGPYQLPNP